MSDCCSLVEDNYFLMPEGEYDLAYVRYETLYMFAKAPKLVITFRIITEGPFFGKKISRFYNVKSISKNGKFKVGRKRDFIYEYAKLFGLPARLDRIPLGSKFSKHIFIGKIEDVKNDYKQRSMPEGLRYSKIAELIKVKEI